MLDIPNSEALPAARASSPQLPIHAHQLRSRSEDSVSAPPPITRFSRKPRKSYTAKDLPGALKPLESTLTQFWPTPRNSLKAHTFKSFRINTYVFLRRKSFTFNTYVKTGGGGSEGFLLPSGSREMRRRPREEGAPGRKRDSSTSRRLVPARPRRKNRRAASTLRMTRPGRVADLSFFPLANIRPAMIPL